MVIAAALAQPQLPWATPRTMSRCVEGVSGRLKRLKLQDLTPRKKRSQCRMCSGGRERICERSRLYKSLSVPALPALWSTTSSAVQVGLAARRRHGSHQRAGESLAVDEYSQDGGLMAWQAALSSSETL